MCVLGHEAIVLRLLLHSAIQVNLADRWHNAIQRYIVPPNVRFVALRRQVHVLICFIRWACKDCRDVGDTTWSGVEFGEPLGQHASRYSKERYGRVTN